MQDQRGKHSSSFFKGTHQCAHKVKPFVDEAFESHYVPLTYMNQQIPSLWGMTAFEQWDEQDISDFFLNWKSVTTVKFPDFTGQSVKSFEGWKYISRILGHLRCAFPGAAIAPGEESWSDYFYQCPITYAAPKMKSFVTRCSNDDVKKMFLNPKRIVEDAIEQLNTTINEPTEQWNTTINEPTESAYLGLIGIDKSASKECATIVLDLLLRAGVLDQTNNGTWNLAANWQERNVYFFGDAKTVENITKFVRDVQER